MLRVSVSSSVTLALGVSLVATVAPMAVGEAVADRGVTVGPTTSPALPPQTVIVPGTPVPATPSVPAPTDPAPTEPSTEPVATPAPVATEPTTPVPPVTDKQGDLAEDLRAVDAADKHTNLTWKRPHEPCGSANTAACPHGGFRGFRFGSYGRVAAATDLRGGTPESVNVVSRGPRIVEPSYLELDLSYGFVTKQHQFIRPIITLAFNEALFHDNGEFKTNSAIRNLYLDAWGKLTQDYNYNVWVGSRMYRGDDVYLFVDWPLDNQNTVGAGAKLQASRWSVASHVGANRLLTPFQFQQIDVANPSQGATTALQLNRQRMVASLTAEAKLLDGGAQGWSAKAKVHGEFASLGAGTRRRDDGTTEELPSDSGVRVGAQVGAWLPASESDPAAFNGFANLFMRYSSGLSAYDDLATPNSFGPDLRTAGRASEITLGFATAANTGFGNAMLAAKARRFVDADVNGSDPDDGWEYAINARPLVKVTTSLFAGADLSYQVRFPRGINPVSQVASDPAVTQIAPMLVFAPMGGGAFDRPQIRLVYRAAHLNQGALDLYVPDDIRHNNSWVHYLGVQAEWWFNASTGSY